MKPKLCRDCKWSIERDGDHELRCTNDFVNAKDAWALSANRRYGHTSCLPEREGNWFKVCGMRGAKWEPK